MNAHQKILRHNPVYPIEMLVLSHSTREAFRSCARKGIEFRQMFGSPASQDRDYAGETGNALHRGLGHWLMTHDEDESITKFLTAFPHDLEYLKPQNDKRSLEACFATLEMLMYSTIMQPYSLAQIKVADGSLKHCVELPFAIKITGSPMPIPVWFVGYIDAVLYDHINDRFVVVDLKTTRQEVKDVNARFQFDEQVIPYSIILEHALGKKIEELDVNYLWAYIDLLKPTHELVEVKKTPDDVHDWLRGLCDDIDRISKYYNQAWWPRATDGKTCYVWNKECHFFQLCYYRDTEALAKMIGGSPRKGLFRNGDVPWVTAELPYIG